MTDNKAFIIWKAGIPEKEYFDRNDEIKGGIPRRAYEAGQRQGMERAAEIVGSRKPIVGRQHPEVEKRIKAASNALINAVIAIHQEISHE